MTIEIELLGGIGNQLFGYSTGFACARRTHSQLRLNITQLSERGYQLGALGLNCPTISLNNDPNTSRKNKFLSTLTGSRRSNRDILIETENTVDERVFQLAPPRILRGYFQSWRYFHDYKSEIVATLDLSLKSGTYAHSLQQDLINQNWTAVHMRRGDYLQYPDTFNLTTDLYYDSAFKLLGIDATNNNYVVFTDDKFAAQRMFPNASLIIDQDAIKSPAETLILMSKSNSFIGSNSSFSWWAAYLSNENSGPKIFPRPWFLNNLKNESDILLPHWINLGT